MSCIARKEIIVNTPSGPCMVSPSLPGAGRAQEAGMSETTLPRDGGTQRPKARRKLGQMLLDSGVITADQLEEALARAAASGMPVLRVQGERLRRRARVEPARPLPAVGRCGGDV